MLTAEKLDGMFSIGLLNRKFAFIVTVWYPKVTVPVGVVIEVRFVLSEPIATNVTVSPMFVADRKVRVNEAKTFFSERSPSSHLSTGRDLCKSNVLPKCPRVAVSPIDHRRNAKQRASTGEFIKDARCSSPPNTRARSQMRSSAQLERRRFERAPITAQVEFELTNSSSGPSRVRKHMANISTGGLFISTEEPIRAGTRMVVRFELPSNKHRVIAVSRVSYVKKGIGLGVEFVSLDDEDREEIETYIASLKSMSRVS